MIGNKTLAVPWPTNMPSKSVRPWMLRWKTTARPTSRNLSPFTDPKSVFRLQSGRALRVPRLRDGRLSGDRQLLVTARWC